MADDYIYDPRTIGPVWSGLAAGAVGAIAAMLVVLPVSSPNETSANPLTVTLAALAIGAASGAMWRSVRASTNGARIFTVAMALGWLVALSAVAAIEWTAGGGWFRYVALVVSMIFLAVGLLTPAVARAVAPTWAALVPVVVAVVLALGLLAG